MSDAIKWRHSLEEAREEATRTGKAILIELFSSKCAGCMAMDAETFSQANVQHFIEENFVPVHYDVFFDDEAMSKHNGFWTPTIIVQTADGRDVRRSMGFLPPQSFVGELALALTQEAILRGDTATAHARALAAVDVTQGDTSRHPEASYWEAVTAYKDSHDQDKLIAGWKQLLNEQPESDWAKRVEFARNF